MKHQTKTLIMVAVLLLAIPLMLTGTASAVNNFNRDGAVLNGSTGLWELPATFCVGFPATWDGTGAIPDAVKRTDRTTYNPASSSTACAQLGSSSYYPTQRTAVRTLDRATCEAQGYTYSTYSAACSSGGWSSDVPGDSTFPTWITSGYQSCLTCHNARDNRVSEARRGQAEYINASHKNASRKIEAGKGLANVWIDTNGNENFGIFPYLPGLNALQTDSTVSPNYNIRMVNWVTGKIEDTTGGLKNLPTGVYTDWYWEFGYYGEDPERGVYNGEAGSDGKPSAKMAACFACHGTGYVVLSATDASMEPEKSFPGISWDQTTIYTQGSRPGKVNLKATLYDRATNTGTTANYGAWDQYGITCSNCHNAVDGLHESTGPRVNIEYSTDASIEGASINAVCGQCHVKASSSTYQVTAGTGVLTTRAQVGTGHPNYHATDYLNSPHARFTGTYGQIADPAKYNSAFMAGNAGCAGCHNPHGSVREPLIELTEGTSAAPGEGIEKKCADCHVDKSLTNMMHPTTAGTPASENDGCVTCHMPNGRHLFRITTDANYTTTSPTSFAPKPDGTFTEAVWMDLQTACGQCHGGGTGPTGKTNNGAPYMDRAYLQAIAGNMHLGAVTPPATRFSINVTGLPADTKIVLKKNGATKKVVTGTGAVFSNLKPSDKYKVKVYKKGTTLTCTSPTDSGNPVQVTIVAADVDVTCP